MAGGEQRLTVNRSDGVAGDQAPHQVGLKTAEAAAQILGGALQSAQVIVNYALATNCHFASISSEFPGSLRFPKGALFVLATFEQKLRGKVSSQHQIAGLLEVGQVALLGEGLPGVGLFLIGGGQGLAGQIAEQQREVAGAVHGHCHQVALRAASGVDAAALGEDPHTLHQGVAAVLLAGVADLGAWVDAGLEHLADASHYRITSVAGDLDTSRVASSAGARLDHLRMSGHDVHGDLGKRLAAVNHGLHHVGS